MSVTALLGTSGQLRKLVCLVTAVAVFLAACAQPRLNASVHPSAPLVSDQIVRLADQVPWIVRDGGAAPIAASASASAQPLVLTLTLRRTDEVGFQRYLAALQDPASPTYRQYLSQAELADRFGPSDDAYATVLLWLQAQGFDITQVSANRLTLSVQGTRAQVERVFKLKIGDYRIGEQTIYANVDDPALPAAIAVHVRSIAGLSNVAQPQAPLTKETIQRDCRDATIGLIPVIGGFTVWGLHGFEYGPFAGKQQDQLGFTLDLIGIFRSLSILLNFELWVVLDAATLGLCLGEAAHYYYSYHRSPFSTAALPASLTEPEERRAQQTVGILAFDTFRRSDVEEWLRVMHVGPASMMDQLTEVPVNGGVATPGAGESEVLLDIGAVMLIAPRAEIVVYSAPLSTSYEQLFNTMINDGVTIISNSWSSCEDQFSRAQVESIDSVLAQAAASGISVFNASGDSGSTCLNGSPNTVGVPANSPHATAVGGTTPTFGPALSYAGERWWGDAAQNPPTGQGGYGVSRYFARPDYQEGWTTSTMRSVPDIAIVADPAAGLAICQASAGGCTTGKIYGGTSMAAPAMAALTAVLNERVGSNLGFANPVLYELAKAHPTTFHSAASMESDFAHVGLGSPKLNFVEAILTDHTIGPADPAQSLAGATFEPPADGTTAAWVRVILLDAEGFPVVGKTVTLTPNAGSSAIVGPASGPSDSTDGSVVFKVTSQVSETVTFTVTDVTDNVVLLRQPSITFVPPPATSGLISAQPPTAEADGVDTVEVEVTLENALGEPAIGKTIALSTGSPHALVTASGASPGVTDLTGRATFSVTNLISETVEFFATNVTDGDLAVPGTAQATFTAAGPSPCPVPTPAGAPGFDFATFATGFANDELFYLGKYFLAACGGPAASAFDAAGNLWVPNIITGDIFKFGNDGGSASGPNKITSTPLGPWVSALAFGKTGRLYALQIFVDNTEQGAVYELNPATGAISRTVASNVKWACPLAVDPHSGDLFTSGCWSGFAQSPHVLRIKDPGPGQPPVDCALPTVDSIGCSIYSSPGSADSVIFDPSGTLYVRGAGTAGTGNNIWSISGTNTATPGTATLLDTTVPGGGGIAILRPEAGSASDAPQAMVAIYNHALKRIDAIDLNEPAPRTPIPLVTGASAGGGVGVLPMGPDGCLYANLSNSTIRVTNAAGTCPFAPTSTQPAITLTSSREAAPTGATIVYTATLVAWPNAANAPVEFSVFGVNPQIKQVHADINGRAVFTQTGVFAGKDLVIANATPLSATIFSQPIYVSWSAGKHVTFAGLNLAPTSALVGDEVTLQASLTDISLKPLQPISGATLRLGLGSQNCQAVTDDEGNAFCTIEPNESPGAYYLTVTFDGTDTYMPSRNQAHFAIVADSPQNRVLLPGIVRE